MSEFELVTMRNRLLRGSRNKAERGELLYLEALLYLGRRKLWWIPLDCSLSNLSVGIGSNGQVGIPSRADRHAALFLFRSDRHKFLFTLYLRIATKV